jgi:hypothetical protein
MPCSPVVLTILSWGRELSRNFSAYASGASAQIMGHSITIPIQPPGRYRTCLPQPSMSGKISGAGKAEEGTENSFFGGASSGRG